MFNLARLNYIFQNSFSVYLWLGWATRRYFYVVLKKEVQIATVLYLTHIVTDQLTDLIGVSL